MLHREEGVLQNAKELWARFFDKYAELEAELCVKINHPLLSESSSSLLYDGAMTLEMQLLKGDWNNEIFQEVDLPYYALFLVQQRKITFQQFATIMERWQTFKDFPQLKTYKIIDEKGEFTEQAQTILIPQLNKHKFLKEMNAVELQDLKALIAALPLSEQIFYTTDAGKFNSEGVSLGHTLLNLGTLNKCDDQLLHMSAGVFDAVGLVRFGIDDYIRPLHRLGMQSVDDIEIGVRAGTRMTALNFPGTTPYGNIHGYNNVCDLEATMHDKYHAYVMSSIPKSLLHAIWYMVDTIRKETGLKWSKEIWTLIDCELNYFYGNHKNNKNAPLSNEEMSKLFCTLIKIGNNDIIQLGHYASLVSGGKPGPLFILILLDMYRNPENWKNYQIEAQFLGDKFKDYYYGEMASIYPKIKDDPLPIQILKCQLFYHLNDVLEGGYKPTFILRHFNELCKVIDNHGLAILNKLEFKPIVKPASDFVIASIVPDAENIAALKGKSNSAYVLVDKELFYVDKRNKKCKSIDVNNTTIQTLLEYLKMEGEVKKLTFADKKKIEELTGFAQPEEKNEHCLNLTYAGKRSTKAILAAVLYDDYAARFPEHREKARKKYVYAITKLRYSPEEAEEYAASVAKAKEATLEDFTIFDNQASSNDGEIFEPQTTLSYGS